MEAATKADLMEGVELVGVAQSRLLFKEGDRQCRWLKSGYGRFKECKLSAELAYMALKTTEGRRVRGGPW
ncbi:hypothetical protein AWV80_08525 [Cupriavidus sp. UYMU48A]|nr:hypothetical protein AWV80_08525 [Cupriavidus sp. UYMU48A]